MLVKHDSKFNHNNDFYGNGFYEQSRDGVLPWASCEKLQLGMIIFVIKSYS